MRLTQIGWHAGPRVIALGALFLAGAFSLAWADPPVQAPLTERAIAPPADPALALSAKIDQLLLEHWQKDGVKSAPLSDDAEFMRRVYLDLIGKIPAVSEVRAFLRDQAPDKRQRLIERLLSSTGYANHFTNVWRVLWLPENDTNFQLAGIRPGFEAWIRKRLNDNVTYDAMVREIILAGGGAGRANQQFVGGLPQQGGESPIGFYQAYENKPENLAASTSRLFLGVKLECAECHKHPFARYSREQFWQYAAFFAGIAQPPRAGGVQPQPQPASDRREIKIPGTEKVVQARFLDETEPEWKQGVSPRETLANWVTAKDNKYFGRAAANRLWGHFFGVGLVDPVDDMGAANDPSHPELLNELSKQFAANNFDLKFLIRAIMNSKAYQLSSVATDESQDHPQVFARMAIKGMSAEQLFDSLAMATGYRDTTPANQRQFVGFGANTPRAEFLAKFKNTSDKPTEYQTSILQALSLMNGKLVADVTSLERSETLAAVVDSPFMDTTSKIETLYLAVLTRKPRPEETAKLAKYVDSGGATGDSKKALADVYWALLNSSEFILNH